MGNDCRLLGKKKHVCVPISIHLQAGVFGEAGEGVREDAGGRGGGGCRLCSFSFHVPGDVSRTI